MLSDGKADIELEELARVFGGRYVVQFGCGQRSA
jgi:hypothetical protein